MQTPVGSSDFGQMRLHLPGKFSLSDAGIHHRQAGQAHVVEHSVASQQRMCVAELQPGCSLRIRLEER